jgi:ABC-type dipeptide/oligopeptide/nickel transport system ATPase component
MCEIMDEKVLIVNNLSVEFDAGHGVVNAVRDISFDIKKGEVFALVGESGCGKSTTAMSIMKLIGSPGRISGGEVLFGGKNLFSMGKEEISQIRGKHIGMIFQNPLDSLNPVYQIGVQVAEGLTVDKIEKSKAWDLAEDIMRDVKINDVKKRVKSYPHEISGGMRQRVMIGMMLCRKPELLIADEPTTALDVTIQAGIIELMKDLQKEYNTSVLLITHDFGIVADMADRIGVMYAGELVEMGDVNS